MLLGEHAGHVRQQPLAVEGLDLQLHHEHARGGRRPRDLDEPVGLCAQLVGVGAVVAVHRHPVAGGDEPDDVVTRHRSAAAGQLHPHVVGADDGDTRVAGPSPRLGAGGDRLRVFGLGGRLVGPADSIAQQLGDVFGRHVVVADRGVECVDVLVVQVAGHLREQVGVHQPLDALALLAQRLGEQVFARLDGFFATLAGEPLPDLAAGPGALDEVQPVAARAGTVGLAGQDLDDVAVLDRRLQRREPSVDARTDGVVTDLGVHRVGEVDRGRPDREPDDLALRGEDVDLLAADVEAQVVEELVGVGGLALPFEQLPEPRHLVDLATVGGCRDAGGRRLGFVLVLPVGGDTVFGAVVHRVGADLDLDGLAVGADDRRVQRLVHVHLRGGDVVLEPPRHRAPPGVQCAEHRITVTHGVDQDAHRDQVVDVLELPAAHDHLLVHGVVVLRTAGDRRLDAGRLEVAGHLLPETLQVLLAGRCRLGDQPGDLVVDLRMQHREAEIFQLPLDGVHAEAVRQRGVDVESLVGLAGGRLHRHVPPGAGVVQAVGEFDDEHPDVLGHRHDHLADGLGLGGLPVGHLVELGDAVDQQRDLVAEVGPQLGQRVVGVFDRVVQQGRREHRRLHPQLGEDRGDRERVGDVRVARLAGLAAVGPLGHCVGPLDERDVGLRVGGPDGAQQGSQHLVLGGAGCAEAHQSGPHAGSGTFLLDHGWILVAAAGSIRRLRPVRRH